jgi:hypothetical protein
MFSGMPGTQIWQYPFGNIVGNVVDTFRTVFGDT